MGPQATPAQVAAALKRANLPKADGPVADDWQSIDDHYQPPQWLIDGKFGIFIHFGLYSIPGVNEWYQKYMYSHAEIRNAHVARFGSLDKFGYKEFIPLFTIRRFDPDEWAELFGASGARWVMPTAEHHDGYSLWDSKVNPYNSVRTGPRRDFIGELGTAVRERGMKFGVTNHTIEHYNFIEVENVPADMKTDLHDPEFKDFYWVDRNDDRLTQHLANWATRNIELIDQYQPDLIWFDNGLNHRGLDPLKLVVASYYFNRAREWGKHVTITGKGTCCIAGSVQDFEDLDRAPREPTDFTWMVHDRLIESWGYSDNARCADPNDVIRRLVEVVARNGVYALNVAPKGDGSIPQDQQQTLRKIGQWLEINGEAIYRTRPWRVASEGEGLKGSGQIYAPDDIRFTTKDNHVYAILMQRPTDARVVIKSLGSIHAEQAIDHVVMMGHGAHLPVRRTPTSRETILPETCDAQVICLQVTFR